MTRYALALTALDEIKRLAAETRAKHPAITDDLLLDGGEIRYMNGMRGTENTWINLGMTCDFVIFYQSWPNFAFIRFLVKKNGTMKTFVYSDNERDLIDENETTFSPAAIHDLNVALYYAADDSGKFDRPLSDLNWQAAETVLGQYEAKTDEDSPKANSRISAKPNIQ